MHNYKYSSSTDLLSIIEYFENYTYQSDHYDDEPMKPSGVTYLSKTYTSESEAKNAAGDKSYWDGTSIAIATVASGKITKAFQNALVSFKEKRMEYKNFKRDLNIGYGRKSSKVTCPNCGSSISLSYGSRFKVCPICASKKIISDSNWKTLETKKNLMTKASVALAREAAKCNAVFVGAIGWHS